MQHVDKVLDGDWAMFLLWVILSESSGWAGIWAAGKSRSGVTVTQ